MSTRVPQEEICTRVLKFPARFRIPWTGGYPKHSDGIQDPAASLNERATVDYIVSEGLYNFHLYENRSEPCEGRNMINEVGLLPEASDPLST